MFNVPSQPDAALDVSALSPPRRARTTTAESLLGLLELRPMSGYELQRTIARTIGNFWQESFGQIYPALRKLVTDGFAEVEQRHEPGNARVSNVYQLTDAGRKRLGEWLELPCERQVIRDELLLKTFCGHSAPPGALLRHFRAHRALLEADLERYRAIEARLPKAQRGSSSLPYIFICLRSGLAKAEAELRWCEESIAVLQSMLPGAPQDAEPQNECEPAMTG